MAEEQQELRRVNWTEVFSFTLIFKSFRMAIHPSKLLLGVAMIVLLFVTGWVTDGLWSLGNERVRSNEIWEYFALPPAQFKANQDKWENSKLDDSINLYAEAKTQLHTLDRFTDGLGDSGGLRVAFRDELKAYNDDKEKDWPTAATFQKEARESKKSWSSILDDAVEGSAKEADKSELILDKARDKALANLKNETDVAKREKAEEDLNRDYAAALSQITDRKVACSSARAQVQGGRIFSSFLAYEGDCVREAVSAVAHGNFFSGMRAYTDTMERKSIPAKTGSVVETPAVTAMPQGEAYGFFFFVLLAWHGLTWLFWQHWVYAVLFFLVTLAVWALFGGAIHRIAALQAAREEKISIFQALRFSASKFLSFFTAPLIPLGVIFFIGAVLALGGLIGGIPYVGEILMGILFFLAIIAGLLVAFLLVGLVTGVGLMYPTIAVEGSDSFDAISRSYSYVFAKPWRASFYGLVALVYGSLTYLFVRLFVFLALAATHTFVKWGVIGGGQALGADANKLDVMWHRPSFDNLFGPFNWDAMNWSQSVGAFLIAVWVFLLASTVVAFLMTYAASSATVIYYLLRRKVDATDLDDVYVEEPAEPAPTPAAPEATETKPPEPTPPAPATETGTPTT